MKLALAFAVLAAAAAAAAGCSDDPAPGATIESARPDQLVPSDDARNDLTLGVRYDDSDGDLGGGVVDVYDCRAAAAMTELAIPEIAPERGQHIAGTLELHVNDIGDLVPGALPATCDELGVRPLAAGTAVFCVVLVDAAGHRGGGDCTQPIDIAMP
jgi:hypothetical protein